MVRIYAAVPLRFQSVGHGGSYVLYIFIVRDAPVWEEIHRISRQELKLGVCGIGAFDGHIKLSLYGIFRQAVQEGKIIFRQLNGAVVA